jgi:hypothetical protein
LAVHTKIGRWLNVHEEEVGLFLWTVALLFLVRTSGIFLNNYAETAFLKRYGVEYMPIVNMANAVVTFLVMGMMTGFMTRLPGARLLARLFVFCGISIAGIRAVIPLGIDLIYPALFMLKSQYEVLLALLFWNLANDLFNTRQSKRLFPLITAGGVVGQILGSFATPWLARWMHLDNLLVIYMVIALGGAWVVQTMGKRYPTLLFQQKKEGQEKKRTSMMHEFKAVLPLMKSSILVKLLVVLTFMPNVVIPIMNYQFNFAVNEQFATESSLIEFFGYFRGVLNIISLVILLFVGKLYDRFGLPVALMFHPFNYMLVFLTFLFRFDALAAMYARMSSNIIRTTINIPATAVVTGLFPESYRAMVRPFLRGTVVRIALFLGSGLILLSDNLFHPRYLSLVAMPFVLAWIIVPFVLKRRYADILLGLVAEEKRDFRSLNVDELGHVFKDRHVRKRLVQRFLNASGKNRIWHARLLESIALPDLDDHLLKALRDETDLQTRIGLIGMLSARAAPGAAALFNELLEEERPELAAKMIEAGHRISPQTSAAFHQRVLETALPLAIKALAVGSLYTVDTKQFGPVIQKWLASADREERRAGILAAGVCRDKGFAEALKALPPTADDDTTILVLESLRAMDIRGLNALAAIYLPSPNPRLCRAALALFRIIDEASLKSVILLLGHKEAQIAELAMEKIKNAPYQNSLRLVKSLSLPQKRVREALFSLLEDMAVKGLDVFRFVQIQAGECCRLLSQAKGVRRLAENDIQQLLAVHLDERVRFALETTLRVLAAQDRTGRMHKIARGLMSADRRQQANSLEALDDVLDKRLARMLMPLLEDMDADARLDACRRLFPEEAAEPSPRELSKSLLESRNWTTLVLTLFLIRHTEALTTMPHQIGMLASHTNVHVSRAAKEVSHWAAANPAGEENKMDADEPISLTDKILHLRNIEIFSELTINELAAVASVVEEETFPADREVFREGDRGDTLYLVLEGDVAVVKDCNTEKEIELDMIGAGDYFGEMALLGDERRSATIRAKKASRFLTLHRQELREIVREYPQIALHICRVLTVRIRHLHNKISGQSC